MEAEILQIGNAIRMHAGEIRRINEALMQWTEGLRELAAAVKHIGESMVAVSTMDIEKDLLTTHQLCQLLHVSRETVNSWRKKYGLPTLEFGSRVRYSRAAVLGWAKARARRKG